MVNEAPEAFDTQPTQVLSPLPDTEKAHLLRLVEEGANSFLPIFPLDEGFNVQVLGHEFETWDDMARKHVSFYAERLTPQTFQGEVRGHVVNAFAKAISTRAHAMREGFEEYTKGQGDSIDLSDDVRLHELRVLRRGLRSEKALIAAMLLDSHGVKIPEHFVVPWFFSGPDRKIVSTIPQGDAFLGSALEFSYFLTSQREGARPEVETFTDENLQAIDLQHERYAGEFNRLKAMHRLIFEKAGGDPVTVAELGVGAGRMALFHAADLLAYNPASRFIGTDISQAALDLTRKRLIEKFPALTVNLHKTPFWDTWKITDINRSLDGAFVHWGSFSHMRPSDYAESLLAMAYSVKKGGLFGLETVVPEEGSDIRWQQRLDRVMALQRGEIEVSDAKLPFLYNRDDNPISVEYHDIAHLLHMLKGVGLGNVNIPPPGNIRHPLAYVSEMSNYFLQQGGMLNQEQINDPVRYPIHAVDRRVRGQLIAYNTGQLSPVDNIYMLWLACHRLEPRALAGMIK